jgi:hypothetical protein
MDPPPVLNVRNPEVTVVVSKLQLKEKQKINNLVS